MNMHTWQLDPMRTRMDIGVLVWRCPTCGCLQIKNDGLDSTSVYKPSTPDWNPFRTTPEEPPCQSKRRRSINVLDPEPSQAR